jgi:hypothetical protein
MHISDCVSTVAVLCGFFVSTQKKKDNSLQLTYSLINCALELCHRYRAINRQNTILSTFSRCNRHLHWRVGSPSAYNLNALLEKAVEACVDLVGRILQKKMTAAKLGRTWQVVPLLTRFELFGWKELKGPESAFLITFTTFRS